MLSFRSILVTALAAICLWGLFSLLDNLREPELLRSPKAVVVKGCEPMESEEAKRLCPQLLCQKALLDGKHVPISTRFQVTEDENRSREAGQVRQVIVGTGRPAGTGATELRFECVMENAKVSSARVL